MIGKIKALGLAFVAITAMSAMASSAAQAGTLDIEKQPAVLTGVNEVGQQTTLNIQKTTGGSGVFSSHCEEATLEGTTQGLQIHEAQVTAAYTKCKLFGLAATVTMHGCKYTLTGAGHLPNTSTVDIVGCTPGKSITIQSASCQVVIPEQNNLSHVVGDNVATGGGVPHEVTLTATVTSITHTQFGVCPDGNNHHSNNAEFTGNTWVKAYEDDKAGVQVTKHGHQYTEFVHGGKQISLTST
jgi:hypothetical protein